MLSVYIDVQCEYFLFMQPIFEHKIHCMRHNEDNEKSKL